MAHRRVAADGGAEGFAEAGGGGAVAGDHFVLLEDVEGGEGRPAGQRVAGVAVGVQEAAGGVVVVEGGEHVVGGEHDGERQVAAGDALGEQQEIRPDAGLLAGEEAAAAPAADGDLVGHQVHPVAVAQLAGEAQVFGVVHHHARGALHQGFDDHGGGFKGVLGEVGLEGGGGAAGHVGGGLAGLGVAGVGAGHAAAAAHQRGVGVAEDRHVGDGQGAHRLAVVAAGEADETVLARLAVVAPVVGAHLEGDLGGRGAVGGVEGVAQGVAGEGGEALGELDHRLMGEAGQHDVLQRVELGLEGVADARVGVAEQIDPPGADAVEVAPAVHVDEPRALAPGDRDEGQLLVVLHLGARVPDGGEGAGEEAGVGGHGFGIAVLKRKVERPGAGGSTCGPARRRFGRPRQGWASALSRRGCSRRPRRRRCRCAGRGSCRACCRWRRWRRSRWCRRVRGTRRCRRPGR